MDLTAGWEELQSDTAQGMQTERGEDSAHFKNQSAVTTKKRKPAN